MHDRHLVTALVGTFRGDLIEDSGGRHVQGARPTPVPIREPERPGRRSNPMRMEWYSAWLLAAPLGFALSTADAAPPPHAPHATRLASGLQGPTGSTVGPGDDLYVAEGAAGRISRIDPRTGQVTTFASGLPRAIVGIGGPMDVAFIGDTGYVLVTLVGADVGGNDVVGIYRIDTPTSFTVVANIGEFSLKHPPSTSFFIPTGVQYALESYRGGFLVTDGHHNRVLRVTREGEVTEWIAFDNVVPTGLAVSGATVYVAQAGPVPHLPADGKVVAVKAKSRTVTEAAAGAPLLVDVEFGRGHRLYALSQGYFPPGNAEGAPAEPHTGTLVRARGDGTFAILADRLNQPTSLEFIGRSAYIVSFAGDIWKLNGVTSQTDDVDEGDAGERDWPMATPRRSLGPGHRWSHREVHALLHRAQ
jgi:DNA-binding beta-propeller fold protein YncE